MNIDTILEQLRLSIGSDRWVDDYDLQRDSDSEGEITLWHWEGIDDPEDDHGYNVTIKVSLESY